DLSLVGWAPPPPVLSSILSHQKTPHPHPMLKFQNLHHKHPSLKQLIKMHKKLNYIKKITRKNINPSNLKKKQPLHQRAIF
ncbi:hypothetical protein ACVGXF_00085, partial [Enterobacter hormaechei]